jgi:hypothetical protein
LKDSWRLSLWQSGCQASRRFCQILFFEKAGWCEKNIWYNLCSLPIVRKAVTEPGKRN